MPEMVAVPLPSSVKVTPAGRGPVSVSDGAGNPRVVTVKVPESPAVKVVDAWLVIAGASFRIAVNVCVTVPWSFLAAMVTTKVPPWVAFGTPEMVAVPLPLSSKVTPEGRAPVLVSDGTGNPAVVTGNGVMAVPAVVVIPGALVMTAGWSTATVSHWLTVPAVLAALSRIG